MPSQSPKLVSQPLTSHTPSLHAVAPTFGKSTLQSLPHAPQCAVVSSGVSQPFL
jgi:hypothetical protein